MGNLVDKAAIRDDAFELVRLAYECPHERADIDLALIAVAQRLGAKRKGRALAHILTLPESDRPWHAIDEVGRQLAALGPRAARLVTKATQHSHDSARLAGARLLESLGETEDADQLRAWARQPPYPAGIVPLAHLRRGIASIVLGFISPRLSWPRWAWRHHRK